MAWFTEMEAELKAALTDLLERVEGQEGAEDSALGLLGRLEMKVLDIVSPDK